MAQDNFGRPYSLESPAYSAAAVTPSDSADMTYVSRGIYVGVTGDVAVNMAGSGAGVTFKAVPAGTLLPIAVARVLATGTTATNIVAVR